MDNIALPKFFGEVSNVVVRVAVQAVTGKDVVAVL